MILRAWILVAIATVVLCDEPDSVSVVEGSFLECDAKRRSHCAKSKESFLHSCSSVMGAVVRASSGQRAVVKEYMTDVCTESVLQGDLKEGCLGFASVLDDSMTDDSYSNREQFNLAEPCANLWQLIAASKTKRMAQENEDSAAEEKRLAQERAESERKAAALRAEAESRIQEMAKKRIAEEQAEKKMRTEEEALEQVAEQKKHAEEDAKAKAATEAKKEAQKKTKAGAAAEAKKVTQVAKAVSPERVKKGIEKRIVEQARQNSMPDAKRSDAKRAQNMSRKVTTSSSKAGKTKGEPTSNAKKAIRKAESAASGGVKKPIPVRSAAPSKTIVKNSEVAKVEEK